MERLPCHFPWTSLYISPSGDVRHCCSTNHKALGNLATESLEEIWNNGKFREVRRHVTAQEFDRAYCNSNCEGLRTGKGYPFPDDVPGSEELNTNQAKARKAFEHGEEIVAHLPTQLKVEFTDICNFRCIMCFYDFVPPYNTVPDRAVEQVRELARYATEVVLMGGEVFMNRADLEFIKSFTPAPGAAVGFVTNASYLDDSRIDMLRNFPRMGMQISIDGTTKSVFESIRVRGVWEVVDGNIRRIVELARELNHQGYEWKIHLAYVVMKSNLENLAHSVRYAAELDVPILFNPVKGFHLVDENVFVYADARDAVPDWERCIQDAFDVLDEYRGVYSHHDVVRDSLEEIRRYLGAGKIRPFPWIVSLLRKALPREKDVGHLLGIWYDLRVGDVALSVTARYLVTKAWARLRARTRRRP